MNEYMAAAPSGYANSKSVFTLALFEDSGWYKANYSNADPLKWGYQYGCNFLETCDTHHPPAPQGFCEQSKSLQCSFDRSGAGPCTATGTWMEGCPFVRPRFLCSNWNGDAALSDTKCGDVSCKGQTFSSTSACFDSTLFDSDFPFPAPPADSDDSCTNDDSWLDRYGDDCSYYEDDASECQNAGAYVDDAQKVCCGCGGGQVPGCVDNLEWVDSQSNETCADWVDYTCQEYDFYDHDPLDVILENCPKACDACIGACVDIKVTVDGDEVDFVDNDGWTCSDYAESDAGLCQFAAYYVDTAESACCVCKGPQDPTISGSVIVGCYETDCSMRLDGTYDLKIMDPGGIWHVCEPSKNISGVANYAGSITCPQEWQSFCSPGTGASLGSVGSGGEEGGGSSNLPGTYAEMALHLAETFESPLFVGLPACTETRGWQELLLDSSGPSSLFRTGGLGKRMVPYVVEVWGCVLLHPCLQSVTNKLESMYGSEAGLPANDSMCFVYSETHLSWSPWGPNSLLKLVDK
mmetsp:Transcript_95455/g.153957  ORF Transcript_95455/g.153957 Transcript_95455/m.153957 type:complete len:521 (+) Transcript_95455:1157-2719(+)